MKGARVDGLRQGESSEWVEGLSEFFSKSGNNSVPRPVPFLRTFPKGVLFMRTLGFLILSGALFFSFGCGRGGGSPQNSNMSTGGGSASGNAVVPPEGWAVSGSTWIMGSSLSPSSPGFAPASHPDTPTNLWGSSSSRYSDASLYPDFRRFNGSLLGCRRVSGPPVYG